MANRGQADMQIKFTTSSSTAAWQDLSNYIDTIGGVEIEALLQQSEAFGDSWVEFLFTGIRKMGAVEFEGFYDDVAASGPNAIFGNTSDLGADRACKLNFGTTASGILKFRMIPTKYTRMPKRGDLTRYKLAITPTGAVTQVTST